MTVDPKIVATIPGWDDELAADFPTDAFSIENSVSYRNGVVYFANSAGLVQGWDIRDLLKGGSQYRRTFRFWTGDDTDASVVIDDKGFLYVASELEKFTERSKEVGQLMKLNPFRKENPVVWSIPVTETGFEGSGGLWSTPALDRGMLYVSTNCGRTARRRPQDGPHPLEDSAPRADLGLAGRGGQRADRGRLLGLAARVGRVPGGEDAARALAAQGRRRLHRVDACGLARLDLGGDARRRDVRDQRSCSGGEETARPRGNRLSEFGVQRSPSQIEVSTSIASSLTV